MYEVNSLAINGGIPEIKDSIKDLWTDIKDEDIEKVTKYLKNEPISVIDGGILKEFEEEFAHLVGAKYAVAYCNGTAALHAASFACGADESSNFLLSEYSYHGTVNSLLENSSTAYLCNYDIETLNIDIDSAEKCIDENTRGIIITHCWGNPVNMDKIKRIKEKYNLKIISDASHAHGAKWNGDTIGSLECEDVVCFSLGKNKLISAGELGIAVTNNPKIYDELLFIGHPNRVPNALITEKYKNYINGIGNKYRPHPLSMVLAIEQIKRYEEKKKLNILTNTYLSEKIGDIPGFKNIKTYDKAERVYWKLLIRLDETYWKNQNIKKVTAALKEEGLTLEQFHNYNISEHKHIWEHERYKGQVKDKSTIGEPNNIIILPGYIQLEKEKLDLIVKCFEKISKNKEELK